MPIDTITAEQLHTAAKAAAEDAAEFFEGANAADIFLNPECWELRDDADFSIRHMTDEEIRHSIVADLVMAIDWGNQGHQISLRWYDLTRFVRTESLRTRVLDALVHHEVQSFLLPLQEDDVLRLDPTYLADACEYCGVYIEDVPIMTSEVVIELGSEGEKILREARDSLR